MTATMRIAVADAEPVTGDVERNVLLAAELVGRAAAGGAHLLVLPEALPTGYDDDVFGGQLPGLDDAGWLAPLQDAVDAAGTVVVLNAAIDVRGRRSLTDLIIRPGEPVWAAYDKQHLFGSEQDRFVAGDHGTSFRWRGLRIALSVCYDLEFPEHAAAAAASGAELYLNSGAYFEGAERRLAVRAAARALDNGMVVAFSGLVGGTAGFIGGSAVFGPLGERISTPVRDGLAFADIDAPAIRAARESQRMAHDRRSSLGGRAHRDLDAPAQPSGSSAA